MSKQYVLKDAVIRGRTLRLDIWYPRVEENVDAIEIGLMDVRASDSIRISYDFGRDGWSIKQASRFAWTGDDAVCDPDWQEVAFVQAWAREETEEQTEARLVKGGGSHGE